MLTSKDSHQTSYSLQSFPDSQNVDEVTMATMHSAVTLILLYMLMMLLMLHAFDISSRCTKHYPRHKKNNTY